MARALLFSICLPLVFSTSKEEILATLSTQQATHTVMKQIIDELSDILCNASEIQAAEAYAALSKSVFRFYIEPGYKQYTFKTFPFVKELEVPDKLNKPDKLTEETLFAMSNFLLRREILADANNALKAFFQNARPHELQPGEKFVLTLVGCEPNPEAPKYYTAEYMLSSDSNLDDDTLALQKRVMVDLDKINQLWTAMWKNMTKEEQEKHDVSCTEASNLKSIVKEALSDSHNDKLLFCDSDNIPPNGNSKSDIIPDSNNFVHLQPYQEQILKLLFQRNIFPIEALNKSPKTHHDSTLHTDRLESSRLLLVKKYHSDGLQDSQSASEITAPSNSYNDSFLPCNHTRIFIDGHSRVYKNVSFRDIGNLLTQRNEAIMLDDHIARTELTPQNAMTTNQTNNRIALPVCDDLQYIMLNAPRKKRVTSQYSAMANLAFTFALMTILYFRRRRNEHNEN